MLKWNWKYANNQKCMKKYIYTKKRRANETNYKKLYT